MQADVHSKLHFHLTTTTGAEWWQAWRRGPYAAIGLWLLAQTAREVLLPLWEHQGRHRESDAQALTLLQESVIAGGTVTTVNNYIAGWNRRISGLNSRFTWLYGTDGCPYGGAAEALGTMLAKALSETTGKSVSNEQAHTYVRAYCAALIRHTD